MRKQQLTIYLDHDTAKALGEYAARRRYSQSMVAEAAIAAFVNPDEQHSDLLRRLNRIDHRLIRLERDTNISIEALMVFVRFWLNTTPPLPDHLTAAARASATARYDAFIETLGQRLAQGRSTHHEATKDAQATVEPKSDLE
jgi:hypothetical protein